MIFGNAGFIGSELEYYLRKHYLYDRIVGVDSYEIEPRIDLYKNRSKFDLHLLRKARVESAEHANSISVVGDITDRDSMQKLIDEYRPNVVYHLAAYSDTVYAKQNRERANAVQQLGFYNLDLSMPENSLLVYFSSSMVIPRRSIEKAVSEPALEKEYPELDEKSNSAYAYSKSATEHSVAILRKRGAIILRPSSVFGLSDGHSVISYFLDSLISKAPTVNIHYRLHNSTDVAGACFTDVEYVADFCAQMPGCLDVGSDTDYLHLSQEYVTYYNAYLTVKKYYEKYFNDTHSPEINFITPAEVRPKMSTKKAERIVTSNNLSLKNTPFEYNIEQYVKQVRDLLDGY